MRINVCFFVCLTVSKFLPERDREFDERELGRERCTREDVWPGEHDGVLSGCRGSGQLCDRWKLGGSRSSRESDARLIDLPMGSIIEGWSAVANRLKEMAMGREGQRKTYETSKCSFQL